ncbi:hypothetical protein [Mesorhizobium sp. M1E.F.Ca.ET.041.01.1.1]|uniref:hypothetical protein n=1 Tax=Mesorhizobium sp. M1E.F.Ca.ET.041.01.1.1 TaxID=2496759 RepID=UPI000FCC6BB7|nr:hypothetical protein [Mesorhizobium sp. M1E.F.Ca.ET.041.01.1.1]RUW19604.1 hypothetical protein EOA38_34325 [Mesorhizobium sp. M1E.F.Ca.ET.041.01.1.1]RWD92519.1 MAG: hypothetical protein EOS38_01425 [Mesorhizobium sp.]
MDAVTNVSAKLPEAARAKLAAMIEARDDTKALQESSWRKYTTTLNKHEQAQAEVERLQRALDEGLLYVETEIPSRNPAAPHGVRRTPDNARINEAKSRLAKITEEMERLQAQDHTRSQAWQSLDRMVSRIEAYIRGLPPGTAIIAAPSKPAKRPASLSASIETVRSTIAKLKADLRDIETAPVPSADAKAIAKQWVDSQAEMARPRVHGLLDGGGQIEFPRQGNIVEASVILPTAQGVSRGYSWSVDPVGLQCWLTPELVIARLEAEIDEVADDARSLDDASRERRHDEISARLFEAECEEERLIETAIADGVAVARRVDADVRAILQLSGDLPAEEHDQ